MKIIEIISVGQTLKSVTMPIANMIFHYFYSNYHTDISDEGLSALIGAFRVNHSLKELK